MRRVNDSCDAPPFSPAVNDHALRTLRELKVNVDKVVCAFPEAILYVADGTARTAWLRVSDDGVTCAVESGFPAFPREES